MKLSKIIANEYMTEVALKNPYADKVEKLAQVENFDIDDFWKYLVKYEKFAFEQGFIRGIAAVKGGAV